MAVNPKKNINKKIPTFPHEFKKYAAPLILAIVQSNEIIGYLPAKAIDNGDGTATLNVSGVTGGGGGVDPVGLKNIANTKINPSTEDTQLLIKALLENPLEINLIDQSTGIPVKVDASGRLLVSIAPPTPPPATTPIEIIAFSIMGDSVDTFLTITNGKILTVTQFRAGSETSNKGTKVELFEDPNGDLSVLNLIDVIFINGNSNSNALNKNFVGNGTRRMLLRRTHLTGGFIQIFGAFRGFET